jgi:hypothetical protein
MWNLVFYVTAVVLIQWIKSKTDLRQLSAKEFQQANNGLRIFKFKIRL